MRGVGRARGGRPRCIRGPTGGGGCHRSVRRMVWAARARASSEGLTPRTSRRPAIASISTLNPFGSAADRDRRARRRRIREEPRVDRRSSPRSRPCRRGRPSS